MVPTKSVTALVPGTGPQDCHEIGRVIGGDFFHGFKSALDLVNVSW